MKTNRHKTAIHSTTATRTARELGTTFLAAAFSLPCFAQQAPSTDDDLLDWLMPVILVAIKKNQSAPPVSETYSYDALGRIEKVTFSDGATVTYTYDLAGNRRAVVRTAPTSQK